MLSWEHLYEFALYVAVRHRLKDSRQLQRFEAVTGHYSKVCTKLLGGAEGSRVVADGYDWTGWAGAIRKEFQDGVPIGFLAYPTVSHTMVFARRRGIKLTSKLIDIVLQVFGKETTVNLIREDYIGLPTISNAGYMTLANRCHHANHLAHYTRECKRNFWDCNSIVEWGGGYGNMARIIRKMNPSITYVIIDLPELLALQYVYLSSIEGEDNVYVLQPGEAMQIIPGKINLMTSQTAAHLKIGLNCDGFISTWAITESPKDAQEYVMEKKFFGAKNLLLGSLINENNYLAGSLVGIGLTRIPVPTSNGVGPGHEYWLR
jgi:hypothetical protein